MIQDLAGWPPQRKRFQWIFSHNEKNRGNTEGCLNQCKVALWRSRSVDVPGGNPKTLLTYLSARWGHSEQVCLAELPQVISERPHGVSDVDHWMSTLTNEGCSWFKLGFGISPDDIRPRGLSELICLFLTLLRKFQVLCIKVRPRPWNVRKSSQ